MMPTICRQCGGSIFLETREEPNPNICHACGDWSVEDDVPGDLISLTPHFAASRGDEEAMPPPDSEAI
jgi:hypothetical protein